MMSATVMNQTYAKLPAHDVERSRLLRGQAEPEAVRRA
jgi:hypothetical protein